MPRYKEPFKALHLGHFTIEWWSNMGWWTYDGYRGQNYGYRKGYWQFDVGPLVIIYNDRKYNL